MAEDNDIDTHAVDAWVDWVRSETHDIKNLMFGVEMQWAQLRRALRDTQHAHIIDRASADLDVAIRRFDAFREDAHAFSGRNRDDDRERVVRWALERAERFDVAIENFQPRRRNTETALALLLVVDAIRRLAFRARGKNALKVTIEYLDEGARAYIHARAKEAGEELERCASMQAGTDGRPVPALMGPWSALYFATMPARSIEAAFKAPATLVLEVREEQRPA